jgi:hypothetical protein
MEVWNGPWLAKSDIGVGQIQETVTELLLRYLEVS